MTDNKKNRTVSGQQCNVPSAERVPWALKGILPAIIIIIVVFAAYLNSFHNTFVFDDSTHVVKNSAIRSFSNIPAVFTHDMTYFSDEEQGKFYRPVVILSFMTDYFFWGLDTVGYHFTNTLLHAICAVLVFYFMTGITYSRGAALVVALLYGIHPAHTEAVTYISGRADSIAAICLLTMLILQRRTWTCGSRPRILSYRAISLAAFVVALLTKELAVSFPIMMLLYEYCLRDKTGFRRVNLRDLIAYVPYVVTGIIWFVFKNSIVATEQMVEKVPSIATRLITVPRLIVDYIKVSFLPLGLHMEHILPFPGSVFQKGYFGPFVIFIFIFIGVCVLYGNAKKNRDSRILFFGAAWFFVGLLPYSNIFIALNAVFAEHWLYLSEIGLILFCVWPFFMAAARSRAARIGGQAVFSFFLLFFFVLTIRQNRVWHDPETFYLHSIKLAPHSAKLYYNLGVIYIEKGDLIKGRAYTEKALEIYPDYANAKNNLEYIDIHLGKR